VWVGDGKVKIERFGIGRKDGEDFEEVEERDRDLRICEIWKEG
jgi:hypothetical protein